MLVGLRNLPNLTGCKTGRDSIWTQCYVSTANIQDSLFTRLILWSKSLATWWSWNQVVCVMKMSMHLSLSKLLSRKYAVIAHLIQHSGPVKLTAKWYMLRFWSCWESLIKFALKKNDKQADAVFMVPFVAALWLPGRQGNTWKTHWAPQVPWAHESCTSNRT